VVDYVHGELIAAKIWADISALWSINIPARIRIRLIRVDV
jgi:hypothetical protein